MDNNPFADLERFFAVKPTREPGDLDDKQLMAHFHCTQETVRVKMRAALEEGLYVKVWVVDKDQGRIKVYRRVKEKEPRKLEE